MTREEILQAFDDINFVYNDCTKHDTLKRMLEELTERKHGEWERTITYYPYCSECGWMPEENEMGGVLFNYCPNCGTKMNL